MRFLRGIPLATLLLASAVAPGACARRDARPLEARIECAVTPDPPRVGPVVVDVRVIGVAGAPLSGATVRLEATMTHPGMVPIVAHPEEVEPGRYRAGVNLDMAGDWALEIEARLRDGRRIERTIDLPGVRAR